MHRIFCSLLVLLFSCSSDEATSPPDSDSDNEPSGGTQNKVYVCDQGSDRVLVLEGDTGSLEVTNTIDIDFDTNVPMEIPHYVVIDETNGYWFVAATQSGYIGMYSLDSDELLSSLYVGDSPALLAVDESSSILYVSRTKSAEETDIGTINVLDYTSGTLSDENLSSINLDQNSGVPESSFPKPHAISFSDEGTR